MYQNGTIVTFTRDASIDGDTTLWINHGIGLSSPWIAAELMEVSVTCENLVGDANEAQFPISIFRNKDPIYASDWPVSTLLPGTVALPDLGKISFGIFATNTTYLYRGYFQPRIGFNYIFPPERRPLIIDTWLFGVRLGHYSGSGNYVQFSTTLTAKIYS